MANTDADGRLPIRLIHSRAVAPVDDDLEFRPTGVIGTRTDSLDIRAIDVAMQDSGGNKITPINPLPVFISKSSGADGLVEPNEFADVAKDVTPAPFVYTVPVGKILNLSRIDASSFLKFKVEIKWGPVGLPVRKAVIVTTTAVPNAAFKVEAETQIPAGDVVTITVTNKDNNTSSIYVTIQGDLITNP